MRPAAQFCGGAGRNVHERSWFRLGKSPKIPYHGPACKLWRWPHLSGSAQESKMSLILEKVRRDQLRQDIPAFRPGDTIRVHVRLKEAEGEKERIQPFEGVVISKRGQLSGASFTMRRVSFGIGVERIFPLHSPTISSIEVLRNGRVRRARLYYLRELKGKAARLKNADQAGPKAVRAATKA